MAGPWSYKVKRRKNSGEQIALRFGNDGMFTSRWYPPWQNDLMRSNAKCMVDDLNVAFQARKDAGDGQKEEGEEARGV